MFARDLAAKLVAAAIDKGNKPRLHPNGFIQLDLIPGGDIHLHVWPEKPLEIPQQKTKHSIHTHCFVMESLVLRGRITNFLYHTTTDIEQAAYVLHAAHGLGNSETVLKPIKGGPVGVALTSATVVEAGQTYSMAAGVLHDSQAEGLTATLMTKARYPRGLRPIVAVPLGTQPDNDFRRAFSDEKELLDIITLALQRPTAINGGCTHENDVKGNCCFTKRVDAFLRDNRRPGCF